MSFCGPSTGRTLLFEHAPGGLGEGGHALDVAEHPLIHVWCQRSAKTNRLFPTLGVISGVTWSEPLEVDGDADLQGEQRGR